MAKITEQAFPWGKEEVLPEPKGPMIFEVLVDGAWVKKGYPRTRLSKPSKQKLEAKRLLSLAGVIIVQYVNVKTGKPVTVYK